MTFYEQDPDKNDGLRKAAVLFVSRFNVYVVDAPEAIKRYFGDTSLGTFARTENPVTLRDRLPFATTLLGLGRSRTTTSVACQYPPTGVRSNEATYVRSTPMTVLPQGQ